MSDTEITKLLTSYVKAEMALLSEYDMPGYDHVYSKKYEKKLRRMFWSEKYFGSHLKLGYVVRYVAAIAVIILSLLVTNEVGARIFGISPWEFITSFDEDDKMDTKIYKKSKKQTDADETEVLLADFSHMDKAIPDGFVKTAGEESGISDYTEWQKEGGQYLQYILNPIVDGMVLSTDGEYDTKEEITIGIYKAEYCVKGNEAWIMWDDTKYNHMIVATEIENPRKVLIRIAESVYE